MVTDPPIAAPPVAWKAVALFAIAGGLHYQLWFWALRVGGMTPFAGWVQFALPPAGFALVAVLSYRFFANLAPFQIAAWRGWRDLMLLATPLAVLLGISLVSEEGTRIRTGMIGPALLSVPAFAIEEFAWRGFLQEQLRPLGRWPRYALIAILWQLCHLDFVPADPSVALLRFVYSLPMALCITVLAGDLVERWKSLVPAVAFQIWVELVTVMPGWPVYTGFFVALVLSFVLYKRPDEAVAPHSLPQAVLN